MSIDTPVTIQQHTAELEMVLAIYRELKPLRVLEIGSLYGGTLYHWLANAEPGADVVSLDIPLNTEGLLSRARWPEWAARFSVNLHAWNLSSHANQGYYIASQFAPYDFIFVDGDHFVPGVDDDFSDYFPLLRPGGCIAFHDINAPDDCDHIDVGTWWRGLVATGEYRTQELTAGLPSGGIGVVWK